MSEPDWGLKRICQSCGVKFYDFHKTVITCPSCAATYDAEAVVWGRRGENEETEATEESDLPTPSDEEDLTDDIALEKDVDLTSGEDTLLEEEDDDSVDNEQLGVETFTDEED